MSRQSGNHQTGQSMGSTRTDCPQSPKISTFERRFSEFSRKCQRRIAGRLPSAESWRAIDIKTALRHNLRNLHRAKSRVPAQADIAFQSLFATLAQPMRSS